MSQHYSNPARVGDPHALPNIEVFYTAEPPAGWYWWLCFPGCLPDSDAVGPFDTEAEAIANATDNGIEADGPWDTDGKLPNEDGESSERENDIWATRTFRND